ncbi:MAG: GHMP kinase [Hyphomicrobiaceae bacterium]|nr:GHMP kinase [Hyphomicrobiaceae bacterium]
MPTASPAAVVIRAPARLHLGFLDLHGGLGRRFGSLGLAIDEPATEVTMRCSTADSVDGDEQARALRALVSYKAALGIELPVHLGVRHAIPAHAGLGSGTQLALAVGTGLATLVGHRIGAVALAEISERGARSAIGMATFASGGFVVDGGRAEGGPSAPVIARLDFPPSWRILLVLDPNAAGVHGDREVEAFRTLPPMSERASAHLSRLTLMRLLPGLAEADLMAFGSALTEIQEMTGDHFAPAQGGRWASPNVGGMVARLAAAGAVGLGQSSWGPTGFAFVDSLESAQRLYQSFAQVAKREGLELKIVSGRNHGASIELLNS